MIDQRSVRLTGPLAAYRDGLWATLLARGYTPLSGLNVLRLAACLSRWMASRSLEPHGLLPRHIEAFVRYRRRVGYTSWRSVRGVAPVLDPLREAGVVPEAATPTPPSAQEGVVQGYGRYLEAERGCTRGFVEGSQRTARRFLSWRFRNGPPRWKRLCAANVTRFILRDTRRGSVGYAQLKATALRSFLRYVHAVGLHGQDLSAAVPRACCPRFGGLPKALAADDVRRLLGGSDRGTAVGRRDRALLLLLTRLGLRRSEVATLRLEDLDWGAGELVVHGKGGRTDRLPLPHDVGEALVSYLRGGRPRRESRRVFLQARAPYRDLTPSALSQLVRAVGLKVGLTGVSPHRLRHTAATQMLRKGASLQDIAQVLRHRHLASTTIYAKVDEAALRPLARAWPEVGR